VILARSKGRRKSKNHWEPPPSGIIPDNYRNASRRSLGAQRMGLAPRYYLVHRPAESHHPGGAPSPSLPPSLHWEPPPSGIIPDNYRNASRRSLGAERGGLAPRYYLVRRAFGITPPWGYGDVGLGI
jgi:hypothetical protein